MGRKRSQRRKDAKKALDLDGGFDAIFFTADEQSGRTGVVVGLDRVRLPELVHSYRYSFLNAES